MVADASEGLTGVAGYVPDGDVKALSAGGQGIYPIQLEPGSDKVVFRVKGREIRKVTPGNSKEGYTFVHVILSPGAAVDTHIKMLRDIKNLQDPTLVRLTAVAVSTVSSLSG
jgi:hypothetical protein